VSRWFRLYDELLDDPKIQKLHPVLFKVLINLWCVASRNDGRLPSITDLGFSLRMPEDETLRAVSKLVSLDLIDVDEATGEQRPHGWDGRQYRSDSSTDRVRAHRKRQKSPDNDDPPNGGVMKQSETFHGTAPEQKQRQNRTESSVASATGTIVPHPAADFASIVFQSGVALLAGSGMPDRQARSTLGRWRKKITDAEMIIILRQAEIEQPSEPVEWIAAAVEKRYADRPANDQIRDAVLRDFAEGA